MPRLSLAGAILFVAALSSSYAGPAGAGSATHRASCAPGIRKSANVTLKVFCGPARATVRYRGKTYAFRNGSCVTVANALTVNVGVETFAHPPSTDAPRTSWFGATIFASRDGTYHAGSALTLSWSAPGFSFLFTAGTVHLTSGRSRGAFSGQFYGRGSFGGQGSFAAASGSFSC